MRFGQPAELAGRSVTREDTTSTMPAVGVDVLAGPARTLQAWATTIGAIPEGALSGQRLSLVPVGESLASEMGDRFKNASRRMAVFRAEGGYADDGAGASILRACWASTDVFSRPEAALHLARRADSCRSVSCKHDFIL
jgi:hypothetical protein